MARVTIEDCLDHVENRFHLVLLASKRARQLSLGLAESTVDWENDKPTVVALREIAAGNVTQANFIEHPEPQAPEEALAAELDEAAAQQAKAKKAAA